MTDSVIEARRAAKRVGLIARRSRGGVALLDEHDRIVVGAGFELTQSRSSTSAPLRSITEATELLETGICTEVPEADFAASQAVEISNVLEAKKAPPNPSRYVWQEVNEVTWKLTNGEMTNVPASFGKWGGYRTTKAIAWVINVAPNAWLARCGDQTSNPIPLKAAKSEAMAMAKGAYADYVVTNPIAHLNGLIALLLDRGAS